MDSEINNYNLRRLKRRTRQQKRQKVISEINVTPFVDVMLVLLIVFMVTAPLLTVGVKIDLPNTAARSLPGEVNTPLEVTINSEGKVFLMNRPVKYNELISEVDTISVQPRSNTNVFLRVDRVVPYEKVAQIIGALNQNGYFKITFVTGLYGPLLTD
jgi:biopolymer transport protein TolR